MPQSNSCCVACPPYIRGSAGLRPQDQQRVSPVCRWASSPQPAPPPCIGWASHHRRSGAHQDQTDVDTPDGLYCKCRRTPLSTCAARVTSRYIKQPGKRAPTVEICDDSDKPFEPIAIRPRTGHYPFDPNAIAQGCAAEIGSNTGSDNLFGPMGTPGAAGGRGYHHRRAGRGTGRRRPRVHSRDLPLRRGSRGGAAGAPVRPQACRGPAGSRRRPRCAARWRRIAKIAGAPKVAFAPYTKDQQLSQGRTVRWFGRPTSLPGRVRRRRGRTCHPAGFAPT